LAHYGPDRDLVENEFLQRGEPIHPALLVPDEA
jgi:hypothetical protein